MTGHRSAYHLSLVDRRDRDTGTARRELAALGARLRYLREDARLSGRELAARAGWHPSKVSRVEHGSQRATVSDVDIWCRLTGVDADAARELVRQTRVVDSLFTEWYRFGKTPLVAVQEQISEVWDSTHLFRLYSFRVVPTPLQTPEYATALLTGAEESLGATDQNDKAVRLRMLRQRHVLESGDKRFIVVLEESALNWQIGSRAVMAGQLGHLLAGSALPSVTIGIVPQRAVRSTAWPREEFFIYDDTAVALELHRGMLNFTAPDDIAAYERAFQRLADIAVYGAAARALIAAAIARLDDDA